MKKLEYNTKSWHSRLYMSTYGLDRSELPDNICNYFWKLLLAIVLFVPSYIGHIINLFIKDRDEKIPAVVTIVITFFTFIASLPFLGQVPFTAVNVIKAHYLGLFVLLVSLVILIAIGAIAFGLDYIYKNYIQSSKSKNTSDPIKEGFKAFKGKYCSKIEWTDKS